MQTFPLLGGKLTLLDVPPRPTEDPLWLAASVPRLPEHSTVLDAGSGSGIAALALLTRQPILQITALDINPDLTQLAARNAELNHFPLTIITGNILTLPSCHPEILRPFNTILCNPPYHAEDRGHSTPNPQKKQAHTLPENHLILWLQALTALLTPTGTLHLILHAACKAELTTFATSSYTLNITPLQTAQNRPAKRLLATLQASTHPQIHHHKPIQAFNPTLRQKTLGA